MSAFLEGVRIALQAIWANRARSSLTILGVVIGVFAIILLIGIGQGTKREVGNQVTQLGVNILIVVPGQVTAGGRYNPAASLGASTLTEGDLTAMRALPQIAQATPIALLAGVPKVGDRTSPATLTLAVEPSFFPLFSQAELRQGRLLNEDDLVQRARVAVLDRLPREALFPNLPPAEVVGKEMTFGGLALTVVGVVESPPSASLFGSQPFENALFLPYATAKETVANTQVFRIIAQAKDAEDVAEVKRLVRDRLLVQHTGTEDFTVFTQDDLLEIINEILSLLTNAISGIAAISLVVGGIGIMNIMLVSVTERTREIGLRKAVGASNTNILAQFLVESGTLSLLGGGVGFGLAAIAARVLSAAADIPTDLTLSAVGTALGLSLIVGILFGLAPAVRASRLEPIDALRYE